MIVKAVNKNEFLGFVDPHGKPLPHNIEVFLEDIWLRNECLQALIDDGDIAVVQYGTSPTQVVSRGEYLESVQGIYKGEISNDGNGIISTVPMVLPEIISVTESAFGFSQDCKITFKADSLVSVTVDVPNGFYTQTTLAALLQADTAFAVHFDAAVDVNAVKVSGKSYGANARVEIIPQVSLEMDANTVIAFPVTSTPIATAEAELVIVTAKGATGEPAQNVKVKLTVYDAAAAGNPVATCQFQRMTEGVPVALYADELVAYTNGNGKIKVELIDSGAADIYVQLDPPSADYFLADTPTARSHVVVTQV